MSISVFFFLLKRIRMLGIIQLGIHSNDTRLVVPNEKRDSIIQPQLEKIGFFFADNNGLWCSWV